MTHKQKRLYGHSAHCRRFTLRDELSFLFLHGVSPFCPMHGRLSYAFWLIFDLQPSKFLLLKG